MRLMSISTNSMSTLRHRHGMGGKLAFVQTGLLTHPCNLRRSLASRCNQNSVRRGSLVVHRRVARILPTCNAGEPNQDPGSTGSADQTQKPTEPSRTLIGRIVVEVLSLMVGAVLLLTVIIWRAFQIVSRTLWRALVWLSNIRQLGRWAVGRVANVDGISMPVASFRKLVSKVYGSTLTGMSKIGEENPNQTDVDQASSQEEEITSDINAQKSGHTESELEKETTESEETSSAGETGGTSGRRLILLRHAKTTWDRESEIPDRDRVLSAEGKEEARLVGQELSKIAWLPDIVLCSDAVRTVQTLSLLDIPERDPASTVCTEALYYAVTGEELAVAVDHILGDKGFTDNTSIMVVCHNPGCEELVEQLTGHRRDMGTACAALLEYAYESETGLEDENQVMRLSPQRKRWTLKAFSAFLRMSIMISQVDVNRFFLVSGEVAMHGMHGYMKRKRNGCLISSIELLGSCLENGGLRRLEVQAVSNIETRSFLGKTVSYVTYALPRTKNGATCKGRLLSTITCFIEGSSKKNIYAGSKEFLVSSSQPVAEVLMEFNVTAPERQTSNRSDESLKLIVGIVLVVTVVFAIFKNFACPAVGTQRRSCASRIVELANQCYLPFRRTQAVLQPSPIFPWDSESDTDVDELYATATLTLYGGAELADTEAKYW